MKSQKALQQTGMEGNPGAASPRFVEAENLIQKMQELTQTIGRKAYEFFESRGRELGHEMEDWFRAEKELIRPVPMELTDVEGNFVLKAEVPGFMADEIKISAESDRIMIEGKTEGRSEEKSENTIFSERRKNQFCRSLDLPAEIEPTKVTASIRNGMLEIIMPKAPVKDRVDVEVTAG